MITLIGFFMNLVPNMFLTFFFFWLNRFRSRVHEFHIKQGLRTPGEEIAFAARPKIKSQSQIYSYVRSIFCLPHPPKISGFFDLCLHWVSVVPAESCSERTCHQAVWEGICYCMYSILVYLLPTYTLLFTSVHCALLYCCCYRGSLSVSLFRSTSVIPRS